MSENAEFWDPPRSTVYTANGRRIRRDEVIGREGGVPPILIHWHDHDTGEYLGGYSLSRLNMDPVTDGPMFAERSASGASTAPESEAENG